MDNATLIERLRTTRLLSQRNQIALQTEAADRIVALEAEVARLREAVKVLRDGYSDAQSGLYYVLMNHGRLSGVGFDRVTDHYHEWVIMPEREGLMAGSHVLPTLEN